VPEFPSPISLLSKQFEKFSEFQNNCNTAVCGAGLVPGVANTIIRHAGLYHFKKIDSIDIVSVSGEQKDTVKGKKKDIDTNLYSEDIKPPLIPIKKATNDRKVFYVDKGKVVEADPLSIEGKSDAGTKVFLSSSPMLTDLLKEFPDAISVRYFKLGKKPPKEHIPPQKKIDFLQEMGLLSNIPVKVNNVEVAPIDLIAAMLPKQADIELEKDEDEKAKGMASFEIYITGQSKRDEKEITKSYIIKGDNDECYEKNYNNAFEYIKGSALIAGVKLMCKDKWKKPGVFTPAAFDCNSYYEAFVMEGIEIKEGEGKRF
jgi:saccharopine dehydrogenase-like NADP-dependent oxidoreductase